MSIGISGLVIVFEKSFGVISGEGKALEVEGQITEVWVGSMATQWSWEEVAMVGLKDEIQDKGRVVVGFEMEGGDGSGWVTQRRWQVVGL